MPAPLDLSRLTRIAFGYVAVWVADALFTASQAHRIGLALGSDPSFVYLLGDVLTYALVWGCSRRSWWRSENVSLSNGTPSVTPCSSW